MTGVYPLMRTQDHGVWSTLDRAFTIERGYDDPRSWCLASKNDATYKAIGVPEMAPVFGSLKEVRAELWKVWPLARGPLPQGQFGKAYRVDLPCGGRFLQAMRNAGHADKEHRRGGFRNHYAARIGQRHWQLMVDRELIKSMDGGRSLKMTLDGWLALEFLERCMVTQGGRTVGEFALNSRVYYSATDYRINSGFVNSDVVELYS